MQHTACRTAVVEDVVDESVTAHLAACPSCARFADDVRRITSTASMLSVPPPPEGLAERVLARVSTEGRTKPRQRGPLLTAAARRSLTISGAVAAAALLVLGTLALATGSGNGDTESGPKQVLLAAAERTEEAGSASVSVEGEAQVVLPVPTDEEPDFAAVPPELEDYMARQWDRMMAQFEAHLREFERRTDEALRRGEEQIERGLEEASRRMAEALERMGRVGEPGEVPEPPEPPAPPEPPEPAEPSEPADEEPPQRPRDVSVRLAVSGNGTVDFDSRVLLDGAIRPAGATSANAQAGFQLAVQDGQASLRGPDGTWSSVAEAEGPLASVLLRPGAVSLVLRAAEGDVSVVGEEQVDGQRARRYRFRVDPKALGRGELSGTPWTAEATIGDDGRVRALRVQSTGTVDRRSGLAWNTDLRLRLGNFGTVVGERPAAAARPGRTLDAEGRSSLILHPFGTTAAASLRAAGG